MADVLPDAVRLDVGVAYVKATGVEPLLDIGLPATARFVVGVGFALTDPEAVERLEAAGATIRVYLGSDLVPPSGFHPKLYIVAQKGTMTVFSGSANLTAADSEQTSSSTRRSGCLWHHRRRMPTRAGSTRSGRWGSI